MASNNNVGKAPNETLELVSLQIKEELRGLSPTQSQISIFKIHNQLRMVNEKAYEPVCVAIGPYQHHNDYRLHYKEEEKLHNLRQMLRRQETSVDRYVQALGEIEIQVRQQYAEIDTLKSEDFIKMMLLDGCFIIEYFRKFWGTRHYENDHLLSADWIYHSIRRDLSLLENQLPFIVLATLFDLTNDAEDCNEQYDLVDLAWNFFQGTHPQGMSREVRSYKHLLDLQYQRMIFKVAQREATHDLAMMMDDYISKRHAVTELKESGIKIKLVKRDWFDIKFNRVTLEIPSISIDDDTESRLRNLVAYEQHRRCRNNLNYVTDYVIFIDCLVNSPKDVELLRRKGVIENCLGDDEVVSRMLNKISNCVAPSDRFYYASIFKEVNDQCEKRRNRWMAKLRRDYFNSPWALISVVGACSHNSTNCLHCTIIPYKALSGLQNIYGF